MKEIDEFEIKIKKVWELRTGTMKCTSSKLICDLSIEKGLEMRGMKCASSKLICDLSIQKGLEMKGIKTIEKGLEKLKISKEIIGAIKESPFTNIICEYIGYIG